MLSFFKAQATGNDFIILDGGAGQPEHVQTRLTLRPDQVRALCDRRFGIGADGLIVLEPHPTAHYLMVYHNADGPVGSMCGNGARAAYWVLHQLGRVSGPVQFEASDGLHRAESAADGRIRVQLLVQAHAQQLDSDTYFIHTGSPHVVRFVADADRVDVAVEGARLRHDPRFAPGGTNVNFVSQARAGYRVRTFERGVEAETLSCGTGVTAVALVAAQQEGLNGAFRIGISTPGGALEVERTSSGEVYLVGPAAISFTGQVDLDRLPTLP